MRDIDPVPTFGNCGSGRSAEPNLDGVGDILDDPWITCRRSYPADRGATPRLHPHGGALSGQVLAQNLEVAQAKGHCATTLVAPMTIAPGTFPRVAGTREPVDDGAEASRR
jgi:hypothetical protein